MEGISIMPKKTSSLNALLQDDDFEVQTDSKKLPLKLDIDTLNLIISYVFSDSKVITRMSLSNIDKLFAKIDERFYETDNKLNARFQFIQRALYAKLQLNMVQPKIILNYCKNDSKYEDIIENDIKHECGFQLNGNEINYIQGMIADKLAYSYIYSYKDMFYEIFDKIEMGDYDNLKHITKKFKKIAKSFLNDVRKSENMEQSDMVFTLVEDNFKNIINQVVNTLKNPANKLKSGLQKLNEITSGGFESGRVYLFLGYIKHVHNFDYLKLA
jgi:hypothetical protein